MPRVLLTGWTIAALSLGGCGDEGSPRVQAILPDTAAVGQPVEVVGEGFGETGGTVSFGGRAAETLIWNDLRIRVRVPSCPAGELLLVVTARGRPSNAVAFHVAGSK